MKVRPPRLPVVKALFALSNNVCAYTGCEERLTDPTWDEVNGEVCHIAGENDGAARYNPSLGEEEVRGFDNLILLCPKHHKRIDRLEPLAHPVERLVEMKAASEGRGESWRRWVTEKQLTRIVRQVVAVMSDRGVGVSAEPEAERQRGAGMELFRHPETGDVRVVNLGHEAVVAVWAQQVGGRGLGRFRSPGGSPVPLESGDHVVVGQDVDPDSEDGLVVRLHWNELNGRHHQRDHALLGTSWVDVTSEHSAVIETTVGGDRFDGSRAAVDPDEGSTSGPMAMGR